MDKIQETKDLDLSLAARGIWLVKVPKYMSDCWKSGTPGSEVGKLIIKSKNPNSKQPDAVFSLNEQLLSTAAAGNDKKSTNPSSNSLDHSFKLTGVTNQSLYVLSVEKLASEPVENTTGFAPLTYSEGRVSIEGKIIHRAECQPRIDTSYVALKQHRVDVQTQPKRKAIQLTDVVISYKPKAAHDHDLQHEKKKKEEGKKTRDDKDLVQRSLFGAFEKHQYYNIKDLEKITRQPVAYLKDILREICTYNVKAPHKNTWELKEEFRHYGKSSSQGDSS